MSVGELQLPINVARLARGVVLEVNEGSREKAARKEICRKAFFSRPLRAGLPYSAPPGLGFRDVDVRGSAPRVLGASRRSFCRSGSSDPRSSWRAGCVAAFESFLPACEQRG
jgi:hypothetical protein